MVELKKTFLPLVIGAFVAGSSAIVIAQTTTQPAPATEAPATSSPVPGSPKPVGAAGVANAAEMALIGMPVVDASGASVGKVAAVTANSDGIVTEVQIATGGFLGIGTTTFRVPGEKIKSTDKTDKVMQLSMSSDEVRKAMQQATKS
jgi:PRC-barrel domain